MIYLDLFWASINKICTTVSEKLKRVDLKEKKGGDFSDLGMLKIFPLKISGNYFFVLGHFCLWKFL